MLGLDRLKCDKVDSSDFVQFKTDTDAMTLELRQLSDRTQLQSETACNYMEKYLPMSITRMVSDMLEFIY